MYCLINIKFDELIIYEKKTKKFSIILILTLILPIFGSAKTIDKNPINNYVEFCRYVLI